MKIFFLVILFFHGLLHFIGVAKAYQPASFPALSEEISKNQALLWLTAAVLFITATLACLLKREWWPAIAISAVVFSQVAIGLNWQEAKFGTLINLLILLVSFNFLNQTRFENKTDKEIASIEKVPHEVNFASPLPPVVNNWLKATGSMEKEITGVQLVQEGRMKIKPGTKWMPFKATEMFNLVEPGFVWKVEVDAMPFVKLYGRDKLQHGKGAMNIKFYHLFNVVNQTDDEKLNSGSMLRYLAEICWFPPAAKAHYLKWEQIDERSAKATFIQQNAEVSGVFTFSEDGMVKSFEGLRYFGSGSKAKKEVWKVENFGTKEIDGIKIPHRSSITWKLESGDFNWLELEIKDIRYKKPVARNEVVASH